MKWYWWIVIGVGVVIVAILATIQVLRATPADWLVEQVAGVDSYAYHRPFFGERKIQQSFTTYTPTLSRISVLIVDLKRQAHHSPITLELRDQNSSELLRTITVPGEEVRDDYYLPFVFEPVANVAGREFAFTLSAPQATAEAPYAVRLTENKQGIAFAYFEATTQFFIVQDWLQKHAWQLIAFASTLVCASLASWLIPRAANGSKKYLVALFLLVVVLGSVLQIHTLRFLKGDPGGDAYYYLVAAHQLAHGQNPLAEWSFRLPFYSFLLMPAALPAIPDLPWGRWLGVITTIALGGALILLARSLKLPAVIGVVTMLLLYLSSDFVVTAVRPRPHILYTLLLVLSLALFYRLRTPRQAFVWGIVLGLMGMTRQEAYPVIAILGIAWLVQLITRRLSVKTILLHLAAAALPLLIIISPYLYQNYQQFGNPFDSPYFHKTNTPQARSIQQFISYNGVRAGQRISHAWLAAGKPNIRPGWQTSFIFLTAIIALIYYFQKFPLPKWGEGWLKVTDATSIIFSLAITYTIYRWLFTNGEDWNQQLNIALLATATVGTVELLRLGRWRTVVMILVVISQLILATWYNPIARLFQQIYPFVALAAAVVLVRLSNSSFRLTPIALAIAFFGLVSISHFTNAIDEVNFPAAPYYVTTQSAENLEHEPAGVAAAEVSYSKGDGMYRLHSYQQRSLVRFEKDLTPVQQWQWLCQNKIRYILDHDSLPYFTVHQDPTYVANFKFLFDEAAAVRNNGFFRVRVFELSPGNSCDIVRI